MNQETANPDVIASNINIAANSATLRPTNFVQNNSGASPSGSNKELLSGKSLEYYAKCRLWLLTKFWQAKRRPNVEMIENNWGLP